MSGRWQRLSRALALVVVALLSMAPFAARADGSAEPPGDTERVIVIGPQAVVIQNQRGQLRMYDDPAQRAPACGSSLSCLGQVLGAYGVAAYLTIDSLTAIGLEGNRVTPPRLGSTTQ